MNIQEMDLNTFLTRNDIKKNDFDSCPLDWELIKSIGADHQSNISNLEDLAEYYAKTIQRFDKVHSVRWRIKDPEHLMKKIIRKSTKGSGSFNRKYLNVSLENYSTKITDLIGIRALHLFKQDCEDIINLLEKKWDKSEKVTMYIRKGDSVEEYSEQKDWKFEEHKAGYRSVHFVFATSPYKSKVFTEIQVRTIFEEGWSEIDHKIRYPDFSDNEDIAAFLKIFNRLAGSADEMGSFIKALSFVMQCKEEEFKALETENIRHQKRIKELLTQLKLASNSDKTSELVTSLESELHSAINIESSFPSHGKRVIKRYRSYQKAVELAKTIPEISLYKSK